MKTRKGYKKITVNKKLYQIAWSLRQELSPLLVVYTEEDKRFEFNSGEFVIPPKTGLPTWKGKHNTAGWDTYEANSIISQAGI